MCTLNSTLGNQQQSTVVFKVGQKHFNTFPKGLLLSKHNVIYTHIYYITVHNCNKKVKSDSIEQLISIVMTFCINMVLLAYQ